MRFLGKIMNIEVKEISKSFGKKQILDGVGFSAQGGQCVGILGGNGSGKSTLLSILAGIQSAEKGSFLYEGEDLFKNIKLRSKIVGYVPQGTPLIEELTAKDNLLLWYSRDEMKRELEKGILKKLGIQEFIKVPVSKMSGGMKKRLSIGCAIAGNPPVILLDEPMAALDLVCKQTISDYITDHKNRGGIAVLVTHDALEIELCDKLYIIKDKKMKSFEYMGNLEQLIKSF